MLQAWAVSHSSHCPSLLYFEKSNWAALLAWEMMSKVVEANRRIYCCCQLQNLAPPAWRDLGLYLWALSELSTSWTKSHVCKMHRKFMTAQDASKSVTASNNIPQSWTPCPVTSLQLSMLYFKFCMKMFNQSLHSTPWRRLHFSGKWGLPCLQFMLSVHWKALQPNQPIINSFKLVILVGSTQYCGEKNILLHNLKKNYQYPPLLLSSFPIIHLGNPCVTEIYLLSFVSIIAGVGRQDNSTAQREGPYPTETQVRITFVVTVSLSNSRRAIDCWLLLAELKDQLAKLWDWKLAPGDSVTWNLKISGRLVRKMVKLRRGKTKKQLAKKGKTYWSCKSF